MDRDASAERDPKPGPVIDSDGTRHYGDPDQSAADTDAGADADRAPADGDARTGNADRDAIAAYWGTRTVRYAVTSTNLLAPGVLTFGYPDTAHAFRPAPANSHASPGRVAAQPDPGASGADRDADGDASADDDGDAYGWAAQRDA